MNTLSAVSAVNGPLELELKIGKRSLRLKASETVRRNTRPEYERYFLP